MPQVPQLLTFVVRSTQVVSQQVSLCGHGFIGEQPGVHVLLAWKQTLPAGQSESLRQPAQLLVVRSQWSTTPPPSQSLSSVQPSLQLFVAGSQYWLCGQTSLVGRQATHWPVCGSQTLPLALLTQSGSAAHSAT